MGLIRRSFTYLDNACFTTLYKSFVRPHLEYASSTWDARHKKTKDQIEKVQRRATKSVPCCKNLDYHARLKLLKLPCLAYRKLRGDMIESYKCLTGYYDEEIQDPISPNLDHNTRTRGHTYKLKKNTRPNSKTLRKRYFTNRIVNFWNNLPDEVVTAPSIASFERRLDKYWDRYSIRFDYDKCKLFEDRMIQGLGVNNLIDMAIVTNIDLDL